MTVERDYGVLLARASALVVPGSRAVLGIAGAPGSGKSTLAARLLGDLGRSARLVPMDGFHLSNVTLDRLGLRGEKGSPRTFDVAGYIELLRRLRDSAAVPVPVPGFDRVTDEPIAGAATVEAGVPLVVTEGNYLLWDEGPWAQVRGLLDEAWFCAPPEDDRIDRLVARHVRFGRTPAAAVAWAGGPDAANAALVAASRVQADLVVDVSDGARPSLSRKARAVAPSATLHHARAKAHEPATVEGEDT